MGTSIADEQKSLLPNLRQQEIRMKPGKLAFDQSFDILKSKGNYQLYQLLIQMILKTLLRYAHLIMALLTLHSL